MQSEALTKFYQAYLAWVEAGAPEDNKHLLTRNVGLCTNLVAFYDYDDDAPSFELEQQFEEAELCVFYPFNEQPSEYRGETSAGTCYLNEQRIAWVREHAHVRNSWPCWSCKEPVTMAQRADADGDCPHCRAELDIEDWPFPESV